MPATSIEHQNRRADRARDPHGRGRPDFGGAARKRHRVLVDQALDAVHAAAQGLVGGPLVSLVQAQLVRRGRLVDAQHVVGRAAAGEVALPRRQRFHRIAQRVVDEHRQVVDGAAGLGDFLDVEEVARFMGDVG